MLVGCAGGDDSASRASKTTTSRPPGFEQFRSVFESTLRSTYRADPLISDAEADCMVEEIVSRWLAGPGAAASPVTRARDLIDTVESSQKLCLSEKSLAALQARGSGKTAEPSEAAFLAAARPLLGPDTRADDAALVMGGRLECSLAAVSGGSLASFTSTLLTNEAAAAQLTNELAPTLGVTLSKRDLVTFTAIAVSSLCPELDDRVSKTNPTTAR